MGMLEGQNRLARAFLGRRHISPYPPGWELLVAGRDGFCWVNKKRNQSVIVSVAVEQDGRLWAHASLAGKKRMPNHDDLLYLRRHWLDDRKAVQVFPEPEYYVNIHPNCLHLFACLDDDPLPEFSGITSGRVRTI